MSKWSVMRWRRHSVPDPAGELRALPGPLAAGPRREGRERRRNGRMRVKGTGEKGSDVNKTFLSRPRPRPRPRLYFLSSRRLETKTLVSRTTSLEKGWETDREG